MILFRHFLEILQNDMMISNTWCLKRCYPYIPKNFQVTPKMAQLSTISLQKCPFHLYAFKLHNFSTVIDIIIKIRTCTYIRYIIWFVRYVYKDGQTLHSQDGLTKGNSYSSNSQRTSFSKRFSASRFPEILFLTWRQKLSSWCPIFKLLDMYVTATMASC